MARPYPFLLAGAVAERERAIRARPTDARLYASLGELYLFEVNWISRSLEMFERAAAIAPDRLDYQWRLYDLYLNNSQADRALATLKGLAVQRSSVRASPAKPVREHLTSFPKRLE